jgi:hypothetical protein
MITTIAITKTGSIVVRALIESLMTEEHRLQAAIKSKFLLSNESKNLESK